MKLRTLVLAVCVLLHKVKSQQINNMGDCACVCGLQSNGGVIGPNGVALAPVSRLLRYNRFDFFSYLHPEISLIVGARHFAKWPKYRPNYHAHNTRAINCLRFLF